MATFWTTQEGWNHRAVQGKPNGALQPCPYSRVSSKWAEVLTRARPASLDLAQRPPGRMDSAGLQRGDHRLPVSLSRPCPSGFWFDISPSAQGEGKEERREEQGWEGWGRSRQGSSGQAGNVSLWRGADWLGTALIGFSFKHHD